MPAIRKSVSLRRRPVRFIHGGLPTFPNLMANG